MLFFAARIANTNQSIFQENMRDTSGANNKPDIELNVSELIRIDNNGNTEYNTGELSRTDNNTNVVYYLWQQG